MKFLEMSIENFGPYYDLTTIKLDEGKNGVTIFWGNNGRGKTTLLNAFRFALYGEIKKRNNIDVKYYDMINKTGVSEGKIYFIISLKILDDKDIYELKRKYSLRKGEVFSTTKEDYEFSTFLIKNNSVLSKPETEKYIKNLLPNDISRFFLFDGELLQEYESLLDDDSSSGEKIKNSIEKILGLPYLTNGSIDCKEYSKNIDNQKKKAIQDDKTVEKFSNSYNNVCEEISVHSESIEESKKELIKQKELKKDLEQKMSETTQVREWLNEIDVKNKEIDTKNQAIETFKNQLKSVTKDAWKYQIKSKVDELTENIQLKIDEIKRKEEEYRDSVNTIDMLKSAIEKCNCPICTQTIDNLLSRQLSEKVSNLLSSNVDGLSDEDKANLIDYQSRFKHLTSLKMIDYSDDITNIEEKIESNIIDIAEAESRVKVLKEKVKRTDYDENDKDILKYPKLYADCETKINNLQDAIAEEEKKVTELSNNRNDLWKKINQKSNSKDLQIITKKADLINDICSIFEEAIDLFRLRLKDNVEKDATEIFKNLSAEKEYEKLKINDNYGLSIINSYGIEAPNRSAGYEHIVALSLIGALHKNAPLKGPIIMDSPFGRLDPDNKKNVCKVLPILADQVVLLMYEDEIDSNIIRNILGDKLLNEHKLIRIGSMHTRIE